MSDDSPNPADSRVVSNENTMSEDQKIVLLVRAARELNETLIINSHGYEFPDYGEGRNVTLSGALYQIRLILEARQKKVHAEMSKLRNKMEALNAIAVNLPNMPLTIAVMNRGEIEESTREESDD